MKAESIAMILTNHFKSADYEVMRDGNTILCDNGEELIDITIEDDMVTVMIHST